MRARQVQIDCNLLYALIIRISSEYLQDAVRPCGETVHHKDLHSGICCKFGGLELDSEFPIEHWFECVSVAVNGRGVCSDVCVI